MGKSLTRKIIEAHYVSGSMKAGEEVFIKVDQTLTHDINAVMTYLAFEAIGLDRIRTECSVSYLDHNLLYVDHKTPDDHIYLQSAAERFGVHVSRPGHGRYASQDERNIKINLFKYTLQINRGV